MNICILTGNLCKDIELQKKGETELLKNTIAVKDSYNKDQTDFINIIAWGKTAKFISDYFEKGRKITVQGKIKTGSYEKDGRKIYTTDIVVKEVYFADSKNNEGKRDSSSSSMDGFFPIEDSETLPF
jgi:single-strand DNA-binding protein